MKDYKLRDLHASHTLGWSWYWKKLTREGTPIKKLIKLLKKSLMSIWVSLFFFSSTNNHTEVEWAIPEK